jgi:hypothetical protein
MSRGAQPFTQHQLTNAIKAAVKSGAKDWRIEITDGKRKMVVTGGAAPPGHALESNFRSRASQCLHGRTKCRAFTQAFCLLSSKT